MPGPCSLLEATTGWRERLIGAARALATLVLIVAIALGAWLRSAQAQIGEHLLGFGRELTEIVPGRLNSAPCQLSVNGLELRVVTSSTPLGVHDALERFGGFCRARGGISAPTRALDALGVSVLDGTLRQESDNEGVIACLDTGRPLELAELSARLTRLRDTGDLNALGALRYVVARRTGKTTTLLAIWTEGRAELSKMFPKQGDAPGRDPEGVPRPEGSRRTLFAAEHGMPYAITTYEVTGQRLDAVREWYRNALQRGGWAVESSKSHAMIARRGSRTLVVRVSETRKHLTVALAELS